MWLNATVAKVLCAAGMSSANLPKWVDKWQRDLDSYDPDSHLDVLRAHYSGFKVIETGENIHEGPDLIDSFANPTNNGYNYILREHSKVLLNDDISAELNKIEKNGDNITDDQKRRLKEIRDLCNKRISHLVFETTKLYREKTEGVLKRFQRRARNQMAQDVANIDPLFTIFSPILLAQRERENQLIAEADNSIIRPAVRGMFSVENAIRQLKAIRMHEQGHPIKLASNSVLIMDNNVDQIYNPPTEFEDKVDNDDDSSTKSNDIVPYSNEWYEWIINHILSADPPVRGDGTKLTLEQIEEIRGLKWNRRNTDTIVRCMLRMDVPRDVHNGKNEWGTGPNHGLERKVRIIKWLGMKYGLQMDPVEPRAPDETHGPDGLGIELNIA